MKRIVTALGNAILNQELRKYAKYDVMSEDLLYQEAVLDLLKTTEVEVIVISGLLQGQYDVLDFLLEVKKLQITARIILIVDTIPEETKNILISKGIFDILYDQEIEIADVMEAIDREEPINLKMQWEQERKQMQQAMLQEASESFAASFVAKTETKTITQVQKQEVIAMFGVAGAGKSTVLANLVKTFAKKTKANILVIDLDTLQGNLDEVLQLNKVPEQVELLLNEDKKCGINYVAELVLKNRFDTNVLEELVVHGNGFDFLSGNTSLHYCQNVLNETCYRKLLEAAKQKYDFIFLDVSSNIFLDATKWALQVATQVLFVMEDSPISLKKAMQQLEVAFSLWNLWKEKVFLIINQATNQGLSEELIAEVSHCKVIGRIKQNAQTQEESYEKLVDRFTYLPKKTFRSYWESGKKKMMKIVESSGEKNVNQSFKNRTKRGKLASVRSE